MASRGFSGTLPLKSTLKILALKFKIRNPKGNYQITREKFDEI